MDLHHHFRQRRESTSAHHRTGCRSVSVSIDPSLVDTFSIRREKRLAGRCSKRAKRNPRRGNQSSIHQVKKRWKNFILVCFLFGNGTCTVLSRSDYCNTLLVCVVTGGTNRQEMPGVSIFFFIFNFVRSFVRGGRRNSVVSVPYLNQSEAAALWLLSTLSLNYSLI